MLDITLLRENPEKVKKGIAAKNFDTKLVDEVLKLDEKRRKLIGKIEDLRAKRNEIAKLGKASDEGKKVKEELKKLKPELNETEEKYLVTLNKIPNLPADDVPVGKSEKDNIEIKKWGKETKFSFKANDHLEIGTKLGIIDFESGAKVSG